MGSRIRHLPAPQPDLAASLLPTGPGASEDEDPAWLVTFSDLVLLLLAFVTLSVMVERSGAVRTIEPAAATVVARAATTDEPFPLAEGPLIETGLPEPRRDAPPAPPEAGSTVALEEPASVLAAFVVDHGLGALATVSVEDRAIVLTISDAVSFPSGSAELRPEALPLIHEFATLAESMPDHAVDVGGHTDSVAIKNGAFPSNLELSLARAANVARRLTTREPGLAARTVATGFGEYRPAASNATVDGRASNRRVELRLVPLY